MKILKFGRLMKNNYTNRKTRSDHETLSNISEIIMGQSPPSSTYNKKANGLPFLQGNAEFGDKYPKPTIYCSEPIKIAEQSDILISVRAPVGDINIADTKLCIGRGLAAIRAKANILHNNFLYYHLRHNRSRFEMLSAGSTFKAIRRNEFDLYEIPLPPLPEQRKIAEILSTVDEAIEKVDEAIEKTERLEKGLMQELLTKGIGHKEFKDTKIGRIPKEWEVVRLSDILILLKNGLVRKQNRNGSGYPTTRIETISDEKIDTNKVGFIENITENELEEYRLQRGDILFSHINSLVHIGKTAIYNGCPSLLLHGMNLLILRPNKQFVLPLFLLHKLRYLRTKYIFMNIAKKAVNQASINQTELGKLRLSLPSFPEQKKIAEIIDTVDKRHKRLKEKKGKFEKIKKGLMNDLLTGNKRVKI